MSSHKSCLVCHQSSQDVPVTQFYYQDRSFYICPQHLPVLIHKPHELVGLLEGADTMKGA